MTKIILALSLGASLIFSPHPAKAESATEIITRVEKNLSPPNFKSLYQFTNYRLDGTIAQYDVSACTGFILLAR
jgi:phage replication-related protein YjqB (UPF0714/DUF867 family)